MASETGVLPIAPEKVRRKGRLQPGRMFLIDIEKGRIVEDDEIKAEISRRRPYRTWLAQNLVTFDRLGYPGRLPDRHRKRGPCRSASRTSATAKRTRALSWPPWPAAPKSRSARWEMTFRRRFCPSETAQAVDIYLMGRSALPAKGCCDLPPL